MSRCETRAFTSPRARLALRLTTAIVCASGAFAQEAPKPPNVVLIYADDVGYGDLGCYGATKIPTPNLDRLAAHGLRFTDGHCSAATCTPSRYSLLTGEHAFRRGIRVLPPNAPATIAAGRTTLATIFRRAGYRTAVVGKWHLGLGDGEVPVDWNGDVAPGPLEIGFDECFLLPSTNDRVPCVYLEGRRVVGLDPRDPLFVGPRPAGFDGTAYPDGKAQPEAMTYYRSSHGHNDSVIGGIGRIGHQWGGESALWNDEAMADVFVDRARRFLDERDPSQPFFLYFSSQDIHVPRAPHPRFRGRSELSFRGDAMVQLDWAVGALLDELDARGLADETLVVFSSDNGPVYDDGYEDGTTVLTSTAEVDRGHDGSGPFRGGKYQIYEGGTRVPLVVRWPGRVAPGRSDALVGQIDFCASFARLVGVELRAGEAPDSRDALDALLGHDPVGQPFLVEEANRLALRQGSWKVIAPPAKPGKNQGGVELYDLATDVGETRNVAADEPERAAAMLELLATVEASHLRPGAALRPPNIVVLYADDLGYGDVGCYGATKIPTPHIDRLASEGIRFTDAHSSSGICTPSRYALLTGRHHWRTFHEIVDSFGAPRIEDERLTLPELLRSSGYSTACIGKWHLGWDWEAIRREGAEPTREGGYGPDAFDWTRPIPGGPLAHGFDTYFGDDVPNFPPYGWIENDRLVVAPTVRYAPNPRPREGTHEGRPGPMVEGWRLDRVMPTLTSRAVAWIDERQGDEAPFFLYFAFTSPHAPIVPTEEFTGKSGAGPYGDFVVQSDATVGAVLDALDAAGKLENTVVVFSSDNGPEAYAYERVRAFGHSSPGVLRGVKRDVWEGGHRVPFIVRWPGVVEPGRVSDALVSQCDLMATVATIVGAELPRDAAEDSFDQTPVLRDELGAVRDVLVHNTYASKWGVRRGRWLLLAQPDGQHNRTPEWVLEGYGPNEREVFLADLEEDPGQRTNLCESEPEVVAELRALLSDLRARGHSAPRLAEPAVRSAPR